MAPLCVENELKHYVKWEKYWLTDSEIICEDAARWLDVNYLRCERVIEAEGAACSAADVGASILEAGLPVTFDTIENVMIERGYLPERSVFADDQNLSASQPPVAVSVRYDLGGAPAIPLTGPTPRQQTPKPVQMSPPRLPSPTHSSKVASPVVPGKAVLDEIGVKELKIAKKQAVYAEKGKLCQLFKALWRDCFRSTHAECHLYLDSARNDQDPRRSGETALTDAP